MCGIAGIISQNQTIINSAVLKSMADALAHRGPDGEGFWVNKKNTAGFAHRRLAIIDLTESGAQPMHYLQRYSIVYNGEIYNYLELRKELQKAGYAFISGSDTEVILAAYDCYKERCLQYFDGMFAFAIWDEKLQLLFAARDRFGEKPFYYYIDKTVFAFASEMKGLWAVGIDKEIENKTLLNYLALGYVQNPSDKSQTFYKNILSLPPSHYAFFNLPEMQLTIKSYWDIDKQYTQPVNEKAAQNKIELLLKTSVIRRLRSDVPVGSSLSGGLDSSTIAYFISEALSNKNGSAANFKTFSAVFPGFEKDESSFINEVSQQLKFKNFCVEPSAEQLITDFEKLCFHQEEPFPSSSIFAQYKVFELAKANNVTVLLDGQGADETMAGYHKYVHWYLQELVSRYKFSAAKKERHALHKNNIHFKWNVKNVMASLLPSHAAIALEKNEYKKIIHNNNLSKSLLANLRGREWEGIYKPIVTKLNDILYFNTMENGLEELLRYADRNSMAHGVEVRLPFLNAELVQFIFSLPSKYKINQGYTKWLLRKMAENKLPSSVVWRTDKVGFEPPQKRWMQNDNFKDYLHEAKKKLVEEKILKPSVLHKKILPMDAHEANNSDWRYLCAAQMMQK
ncbi:MAG: asparagine synthase (glutamine-hydrolyzing) [Ferruginibacter sp.]